MFLPIPLQTLLILDCNIFTPNTSTLTLAQSVALSNSTPVSIQIIGLAFSEPLLEPFNFEFWLGRNYTIQILPLVLNV